MSTGRHHSHDPYTNTDSGPAVGNSAEPGAEPGGVVAFTARGEAALNELADSLTADLIASHQDDPASLDKALLLPEIEELMGRVMSADVEDLASGLIAADTAHNRSRDRLTADTDIRPTPAWEPEWETVRAAMVRPGDLTPARRVDDVDPHGGVRRIGPTIDGVTYGRGFDDRVDRALLETGGDRPGDDELDLGLGADVDQHVDHHVQEPAAIDEPAPQRLGRTPEQRLRPSAPPRSAAPGR